MPVFVVLLRAVNVGGTGKLPMGDLKRLCEKAGFQNVRTYIASGNVVAERDGAEAKAALEAELGAYAGKPVGVIIRTAAEMAKVVADNPFPRPRPASRRFEGCQRPGGRGASVGRARDLCPLSGRDRPLQAAHPCCWRRDRAQYEHSRETCRDGGPMIATKDSLYRNKLLYYLCPRKDAGPIIAAPFGRSAQNPDATRKWRSKTLIVFDSDSEMTA
jgi:hypothetical protein